MSSQDASNSRMDSANRRLSTLVHQLDFDRKSSRLSPGRSVKPRAAVLICLFKGDPGDMRVFLVKRAPNLSGPGEIVLPGGRWEEGDKDDIETALREAKAEIGLDPSLVKVISILHPLEGLKSVVTPVLVFLRDKDAFCPVLNPDEVVLVFDVPLEMFLKDENRRAEEKETPNGEKYHLQFFSYQPEDEKRFVIWGFTAAVLINAASFLYHRPPTFSDKTPKLWHV